MKTPPTIQDILRFVRRYNGGLIVIGRRPDGDWLYLNDCDNWHSFGDPEEMEDPQVYVSLMGALKKADVMEGRFEGWIIDITFWIHPDYGVPNEKYQRMTGFRYQGSPRK